MQLREVLGDAGARRADVEVTALAYDNRARRARARCSSASPASRATATTSPPTRSPRAPPRWSSSARSASACPRCVVDDVRAAMAPGRRALQRRPDGAAARSSASPARTARRRPRSSSARCSRPPGAQTGLLGTVNARRRRRRAADGAHDARGDRPPARRSPRCSTPATRACAMEVSSHALALHRADAIHWAVGVFTNLTQDHLDFHPTMEDYFLAKRRLFDARPGGARSSTSTTPTARRLARRAARRASPSRSTRDGRPARHATSQSDRGGVELHRRRTSRLRVRRCPGRFNVLNVLGAVAAARALGVDDDDDRRGAAARRPRPRALRAGRRGPGLRRPRRLRPHARLAGERRCAPRAS